MSNAIPPARRIKAPEIYTGTAVVKLAYNAIIGAYRKTFINNSKVYVKAYNQTKYPCGSEYQSITSSTIFGWKYFGRHGVKNSIHDLKKKEKISDEKNMSIKKLKAHITTKRISTIPAKQSIRVPCSCAREKEGTSQPYLVQRNR